MASAQLWFGHSAYVTTWRAALCMDTREVERSHDQLRSSRDSGTRFTLGVTTCAHGGSRSVSLSWSRWQKPLKGEEVYFSIQCEKYSLHDRKAGWVVHTWQENLVAMTSQMVPTRKQRDLGPELDVDENFKVLSLMAMPNKLGPKSPKAQQPPETAPPADDQINARVCGGAFTYLWGLAFPNEHN